MENSIVLERSLLTLWEQNIPFLLLGGGSNILVSDKGVRGLVILNRCAKIKVKDSAGIQEIWAEAGGMLGQLSRTAAETGFTGMEWASLIPGTVGGAVYGNQVRTVVKYANASCWQKSCTVPKVNCHY